MRYISNTEEIGVVEYKFILEHDSYDTMHEFADHYKEVSEKRMGETLSYEGRYFLPLQCKMSDCVYGDSEHFKTYKEVEESFTKELEHFMTCGTAVLVIECRVNGVLIHTEYGVGFDYSEVEGFTLEAQSDLFDLYGEEMVLHCKEAIETHKQAMNSIG